GWWAKSSSSSGSSGSCLREGRGACEMAVTRREFIAGSATGAAGLVVGGVLGKVVAGDGAGDGSSLSGDVGSVAEARGLTPDEVMQAVKTVVPPGRPDMDEFYILASGGHSGQIIV